MSELKCPFCQQELGRKNINDRMCSNEKCVSWKGNFYGSEDLWQELIRTRKALDIAWDGLKKIGSGNIIEHSVVGHENDNKIFIANKALEQITALEQKQPTFVHNKIKFPEYNDNLLEEFDKQFFENGQDDDLTETALEQKEEK